MLRLLYPYRIITFGTSEMTIILPFPLPFLIQSKVQYSRPITDQDSRPLKIKALGVPGISRQLAHEGWNFISEIRTAAFATRIYPWYSFLLETEVAQWLRHYATNRKVASSIPDGFIGIFH